MNVFWENTEKTVLVREFPKYWTWDDYRVSICKMREMLEEVHHDVFIVNDCREVEWLPKGSIHYFCDSNRNLPPQVVMRILVSENELVKAFVSVLRRSMPRNFSTFYWVSTMAEAHNKIAQTQPQ